MSERKRIRIESIALKDLHAFAVGFIDDGAEQEIAPITKQRALSQSKNPDGDPDDVALLVAYEGDHCVGYQGLLPVRLATEEGESKAFWCTAMYVLPEYRARMVAVQLVRRVLALKQDFVLNEFTEAAGKIYAAMRFKELPPLTYLRVRCDRLNLPGLPFRALMRLRGRFAFLRRLGRIGLSVSDVVWAGPLKRLLYSTLNRRCRGALEGLRVEEVERVRPRGASLPRAGSCFRRDVAAVNWTLEWPWIRAAEAATVPPYFFADVSDVFQNTALEINGKDGEYRGFVVLTVVGDRGRVNLKLRDFDLDGDDREDILLAIVARYAARYRPDVLELPVRLQRQVRERVPLSSLLSETAERPYLFRPRSKDSPLALAHEDLVPDLSDGDTAFW